MIQYVEHSSESVRLVEAEDRSRWFRLYKPAKST